MAFNPTRAITHNEGCDLHYWYLGKGPLITFIPGGNGHGRQFNNMMAALSDRFTCVTFDRRQMSASQVPGKNKRLNPAQQARDIRAVIKAVGFDKSILFGSSSGGIFGFQFALDFPDMVDHLIAHEAATLGLLPDATALMDWFYHLLEVYDTRGLEPVVSEFNERMIGYNAEGVPKTVSPEPENVVNFWDNEVAALLAYMPNFWRLKENKTSIGLMRGVRCEDAWFARVPPEQAKILDCPMFVVPGHHQGFEVETKEFLPSFLEMLDTLEKKRGSN